MSLTLATKIYKGCIFIWKGQNYLVNDFYDLNDEIELLSVWLVDKEGDFTIWTGHYAEFYESVVK